MPSLRLRPVALGIAPAAAVFLVLQACGGGGSARADNATADPLEGVWESVITTRDCTSSAPVATFIGAQVFHRGGTMTDTNASPTATRGPGFGTWTRSGDTYTVHFRFYAYNAAGTVAGVTRVTRSVTIAPGGTTANSVNTNQSYDLTGAPTSRVCATDVSTRVL